MRNEALLIARTVLLGDRDAFGQFFYQHFDGIFIPDIIA